MRGDAARFLTAALLLSACSHPPAQPGHLPFDSLFVLTQRIPLRSPDGVVGKAAMVLPWRSAIAVVDEFEANVKVFAEDGTHVRTLGSRGGGPGEFLAPIGAVVLESGRLAVLDGRRAEVTLFDWPGIRDTGWSIGGYEPGGIARLGEGIVLAATIPDSDSGDAVARRRLHVFTADGQRTASFLSLPHPPAAFGSSFSTVRLGGNGRQVLAGMILADTLHWLNEGRERTDAVPIRTLGILAPDWSAEGITDLQAAGAWGAKQTWLWSILPIVNGRAVVTFLSLNADGDAQYANGVIAGARMAVRSDWDGRYFVGTMDSTLVTVDYSQDGSAVLSLYRFRDDVIRRLGQAESFWR